MKSVFAFITFYFLMSCANSQEGFEIWGEIEKKSRVNGKVQSQKMFAKIPNILTPNSSEFGRLKVEDQKISKLELDYKAEKDKAFKVKRSYKVRKGLVDGFNLSQFEKEIELHRPGILTLQFFNDSTPHSRFKIKVVRGE